MYLRQILENTKKIASSADLQKLQHDLEQKNFQVVFEKEETLQEFAQLFQGKTLVKSQELNSQNLENFLISVMSALIFEKKYEKISDTKIFQIISILSTKLKLNTQQDYFQKTISIGTIYVYIIKKMYPNLQDFNPTHRKIKQKCEEDAKHLYKLFENIIKNYDRFSMSEMSKKFLKFLSQLIRKAPNLFKQQRLNMQNLIFNKIVQGDFAGTYDDILEEICEIQGLLPLCINKQVEYLENLQASFDLHFENLANISLAISYRNEGQILLQESEVNIGDLNQYQVSKIITNCGKVIVYLLKHMKGDMGLDLNLKKYLSILNQIIREDLEFMDKKSGAKLADKILTASVEKQVLQLEEYQEVSLHFKQTCLKVLRQITKSVGQGMSLHIDFLYNLVYFIQINLLQDYKFLMLDLNKTLKVFLRVVKGQFHDYCQQYVLEGVFNPLQVILSIVQNFGIIERQQNEIKIRDEMQFTKSHSKKGQKAQNLKFTSNNNSLGTSGGQQDVCIVREFVKQLNGQQVQSFLSNCLSFLESYMEISGSLEVKSENIAKMDSVFCKIFLYPQVIAKYFKQQSKNSLFGFLQAVLFFNSVRQEDNLLIQEFNQFLVHFQKVEVDQGILAQIQAIYRKLQYLRLNKKISTVDNSIVIGQYQEQFQQFLENDNYFIQKNQEEEGQEEGGDGEEVPPQKKVKKSQDLEQQEGEEQQNEGWGMEEEEQQQQEEQNKNAGDDEKQQESIKVQEFQQMDEFDDLGDFGGDNNGGNNSKSEQKGGDSNGSNDNQVVQEQDYQQDITDMPKPCFDF